MQIEVDKFLAISTKNNYITTPESCIGRTPMICDSNISYNRRFFCECAVIAGKKEIKKECKFTVKKMKNETIMMRVDSNRFMLSTKGEDINVHLGKDSGYKYTCHQTRNRNGQMFNDYLQKK